MKLQELFMEIGENELIEHRLEKLRALRDRGLDPFAIERYDRTHTAEQVISSFESLEGAEVSVAGRIVSYRPMGKASFAHLLDASGKIQAYIKSDAVGQEAYDLLEYIDI